VVGTATLGNPLDRHVHRGLSVNPDGARSEQRRDLLRICALIGRAEHKHALQSEGIDLGRQAL
jgi:hypothetical protein